MGTMAKSMDGMVILSEREAKEVAQYLRRVKPNGKDEEQRVFVLVHELEEGNVHAH
jgi:hypothetical protein